jgi:glycosyltransferase involved in cell wall biosynthesis
MPPSRRFCMITTFYPPYSFGGDGIFVHRLANELAHRGHHVEVIHCRDAYRLLARREPSAPYADHPNVTVHGLESSWGMLSPLATHQTGFPLFKAARIQEILRSGFDVIHYHNISLLGPKILTYGQGIKLYTLHEYWLVCPTHVLFRFNRAPCTRPHCFACSLTYKRPPQWWRHTGLLQSALKQVHAIIAPSRFCKDLHHQMGLDVPIVHLPNFVPAAETVTSPSPLPGEQGRESPYFLCVGRLEKLKGMQTLIPLFCRYRKAQLWIAGTGSYESQLRQLAAGNTNIRFLGYMADRDLQVLYRQAVAVLVPSLCLEIFPLVILEAFRQQTPAVVRSLGGMPEIIMESGGGCQYHTEQELVAALDALVEDPSYRHALGRRGYQAYRQYWTADAHLQRYLTLISELAATHGWPIT